MMEKQIETCQYNNGDSKLHVIISKNNADIINFTKEFKNKISKILLQEGGILFRNFSIRSVSEFNKLAQFIIPKMFGYIYRSTPRTNLGGKIYTATEYPADRAIPLHNEFSYFRYWPEKIMFFCVIPPDEGGETPIADSRKIYNNIPENIIKDFNQKKVLYVRNYTSGIDLSWQEVFQTEDKTEVEEFCKNNDIEFKWHNPNPNNLELTTRQICQATIKHPQTKNNIWFNQAHLFHYSSLSDKVADSLIKTLGKENLTRNAYYGDNSELNTTYLKTIREAYEKETIKFQWKRGDVMLLDNVLMTHGRTSYKGNRKIAVAMGNS